jgi:Domain of unknown function (DUF397)
VVEPGFKADRVASAALSRLPRSPYGSAVTWRKSSLSAHNGNCVEVGIMPDQNFAVRDSKESRSPILFFTPGEWAEFVHAVKLAGARDKGVSGA